MLAKPIRRSRIKRRRAGRPRISSRVLDPGYLAFLHTLPCFCCYREAYEFLAGLNCDAVEAIRQPIYGRQKSPTEAAHVGLRSSRRGMSQKFPDDEAIPLCGACHREGPESIHKIGADAFFAHHGAGRDETIRLFQNLYAEHCR